MRIIKPVLAIAAGLLFITSAEAMPAWRGVITRQQPDGTTVNCRLLGDEYGHALVTTDGYLLGENASGALCYASMDKSGRLSVSSVEAHQADARSQAELSYLSSVSTFDASLLSNAIVERKTELYNKALKMAPQQAYSDTTLTRGKARGIVILVSFADNDFQSKYTRDVFDDKMNKQGYSDYNFNGSCRDYFIDQSNGVYSPSFDVVGPVKLSKVMSYYGSNGSQGEDLRPGDMVKEACVYAHDSLGVDFSKYDNNHDGTADFVYIIYAGYAESYGAPAYTIWPHKSSMVALGYDLKLDGVAIDTYACSNELSSTSGDDLEGIGSFCHEFGHVLGLPDLYNTRNSGDNQLGDWDIMDRGSYNNDQRTPPAYSAFERYSLGWMDLTDIDTPADTMTLGELTTTHQAYRIATATGNEDEYFILENRQQRGWDAYTPGKGLMITHINYVKSIWDVNTVNVGLQPHVDMVEADGNQNSNTQSNLYPTATNNMFTDYSTPNSLAWDGTPTEKGVSDIMDNDGVISFTFMKDRLPRPVLGDATDVTDHSFVANWKAIDDAIGYRLTVNEILPDSLNPIVDKEDFAAFTDGKYPSAGYDDLSQSLDTYMSSKGWTGSGVYSAGGYIRIGSYNNDGSLLSPAFNKVDGQEKLTVSFHASANPGKKVSYTVSMIDTSTGETVSSVDFKADRSLTVNTVVFSTVPESYRIRIATQKERLFLDDLVMLSGEYNDSTAWTCGPRTIVIDSIEATSQLVDSLTAGRTYQYYVVALASQALKNSQQSATAEVVLASGTTGVNSVSTFAPVLSGASYSLDGIPSTRGLVIVRGKNGKYIKVFRK